MTEFSDLKGKTIISFENTGDEINIVCSDGTKYKQVHFQDCCESVSVESIDGDIEDILNSEILVAEDSSNIASNVSESGTWTFYKLDTAKGGITVRWLGQSNGYYSESVNFIEVE